MLAPKVPLNSFSEKDKNPPFTTPYNNKPVTLIENALSTVCESILITLKTKIIFLGKLMCMIGTVHNIDPPYRKLCYLRPNMLKM